MQGARRPQSSSWPLRRLAGGSSLEEASPSHAAGPLERRIYRREGAGIYCGVDQRARGAIRSQEPLSGEHCGSSSPLTMASFPAQRRRSPYSCPNPRAHDPLAPALGRARAAPVLQVLFNHLISSGLSSSRQGGYCCYNRLAVWRQRTVPALPLISQFALRRCRRHFPRISSGQEPTSSAMKHAAPILRLLAALVALSFAASAGEARTGPSITAQLGPGSAGHGALAGGGRLTLAHAPPACLQLRRQEHSP